MTNDFSVQALECPKCGATVEKSGRCTSCRHLLLINREYGILAISDEEIKGIEIREPSKEAAAKSNNPNWSVSNWQVSERFLRRVGNGNAMLGARLFAKWAADHPDRNIIGARRPEPREIEDHIIDLLILQNAD